MTLKQKSINWDGKNEKASTGMYSKSKKAPNVVVETK